MATRGIDQKEVEDGAGASCCNGALLLPLLCGVCAAQSGTDWRFFNGGLDGDHYSRLKQINRANVHELKQAWIFDTGEKGGIQDNPLVVGQTLYAYTPTEKVVALDAATGKLKWKFDSGIESNQPDRGMTWWTDDGKGRVFVGVLNFLYCLDAETGKPVESFGESGRVDLRKGLRGNYEEQSVVLTSPGVIYKDMIIVGGRNPETHPARRGIFARSICTRGRCAGRSIRFLTRAKRGMRRGRRRRGRRRGGE